MAERKTPLRIVDKLKAVISKYYRIEVFQEDKYHFEPICIISATEPRDEAYFRAMQRDFGEIGYSIKFHTLKNEEKRKYNLVDSTSNYFLVDFEAKDFEKDLSKSTRNKKIQLILLGVTIAMVLLSAWVYDTYFDFYYGGFWALFSFCLGMFLIILFHEFGHFFISRFHKLDASLPYLLPGPPPIGMLGAFVSIRDDPQTRNQKFDVAFGGIALGIIISLLLVIIGLIVSTQVDTGYYLQLRYDALGTSLAEEAEFVQENLNSYNYMVLTVRALFFEQVPYANYYGFWLPAKLVLIHPLAFTGWIGLLLSGLNLIPISFQDGGLIFKAIFPYRFTKLLGFVIGLIIFLFLSTYLLFFALFGLFGAINDLNPQVRSDDTPNPMIPLKRSRKILAITILGLFVLLFPLTFNNLMYGFGF
ncbi:MAG: site-2 protease family protein [Candidatus Helarchaeota archaeon]|nr:site-2 protease family protein [Candidatus Helarchaeota archaeon]